MPLLAKQFENVFPELTLQLDFVSKVVKEEEDAFLRTLDKGLRKIDDIIKDTRRSETGIINGKAAFELFDTYGFPIDLTRLIGSENSLLVDEKAFEAEMLQQKSRSRAATTIDTEDWVLVNDEKGNGFVGYDDILVYTRLSKYRKIKAKGKEHYQLVLSETPFYAESGGQVGDTGMLEFGNESIKVTDTRKENDLIIHFTDSLPADVHSEVIAKINVEKRLFTSYNHTATHLLHAALRQVLGKHVAQKGSLVNDQELRFDFSHFTKITDEELRSVEKIVNDKIRENIKVITKELPKEEALQLGAMALFGEKYGDKVRVVIIDPAYSVELCGGTHIMNTGMIGTFKIVSESAVAAGVRRLEALTGSAAFNYLYDQLMGLKEIANLLKTKDPVKAIEKILQEKLELERKVEKLETKQLLLLKDSLLSDSSVFPFQGKVANFIGTIIDISNPDQLKKLCFELKPELGSDYLVVLAANINGKPNVAVMISESLIAAKGWDAPQLIKEHIATLIKGGGGGQRTLATAGGQDASNLPQVIENIKTLL